MEIGGLLAVAVTVGLLAAVTLLVARGPETLTGGLFRVEQPGWPHGVQEDDDFRWRWNGPPVRAREPEPRDPPAVVTVQRLQPVLRLCDQPRSEARARS